MRTYDPIQSLWIGNVLSPMEQMCIQSYQQQGHEFYLYVYEPVEGVPAGTIIKDAAGILPPDQLFVDEFGGYVNVSNQFRYALLYKKGGWWVDMDTVCIKPFDFSTDFVFSSERYEKHDRIAVNTTYIKSLPGARFLKDCLDFMQARGTQNLHWGELGINLISRMIFRNQMGEFVQQPEIFCPVSISRFDAFLQAEGYELPEASYALHWWHELWKRYKFNKNNTFSENCLYERFKRTYLKT